MDIGFKDAEVAVEPIPNWASEFRPQQEILPLSRMEQVCVPPAETATAVLPTPRLDTSVGDDLSAVAPLPSRPSLPLPQQETEPLSRTAQVWSSPEERVESVSIDPSWKPGMFKIFDARITSFESSICSNVETSPSWFREFVITERLKINIKEQIIALLMNLRMCAPLKRRI